MRYERQIEVKSTTAPVSQDARHLQIFLNEYPQAKNGYIICQTPYPMKISENIMALPWQNLDDLLCA